MVSQCACPTRVFRDRAFCEQEDNQLSLPSSFVPRRCLRVTGTLPEERGIRRGFTGKESWN